MVHLILAVGLATINPKNLAFWRERKIVVWVASMPLGRGSYGGSVISC